MTRRARDTFSGTLRPNDPRRFLVEAMLGAMAADGNVDDRELAVMNRHLDEHEMFTGLSERNQAVLLEVARDALKFAGNALARIPAIAIGLPGRLHRVTALAMSCEIVVADDAIDDAERLYLETLRLALRIAPNEFNEIFAAAREHRSTHDLDARMARFRELVPSVVELFALRSLSLLKLSPDHRAQVRDLLVALPDMALRDHELENLVEQAYNRMHVDLDLEFALEKVALKVRDPIDRYWSVVYLMCAEPPGMPPHWRTNHFLTTLKRVFALGSPYLDLAATDAAGFPSHLPRPS
jgi:uncharacterized tellurite resistance protein B-like protein